MFSSNASQVSDSATYIEDVFSTWLTTGSGSSLVVNNGIDLSGEGGLVWQKGRNSVVGATSNTLFDTVRGVNQMLQTNSTSAQINASNTLTAFNSNGFEIGTSNNLYASGQTGVNWTFRKQPKFFDVVTYTGNGVAGRQIAHSLGSTPGCIIVKNTSDGTQNWVVKHRSSTLLYLNLTNAAEPAVEKFCFGNNVTAIPPDASVFTVGSNPTVNANGATYVAYLFAHDAGGFGLTGTDNVISCGSYTGNGSATGPVVTLGYEPQWVLIKNATIATTGWVMLDSMRGWVTNGTDTLLRAESSAAELTSNDYGQITATGFELNTTNSYVNNSGSTMIYIAIRRGPMKVPTSGTSVYSVQTYNGNATARTLTTGFPVDVAIAGSRASASVSSFPGSFTSRLTGANKYIVSSSTAAEVSNPGVGDYAVQNGIGLAGGNNVFNWTSTPYVLWAMRRAPGFMDAVCHTGTGANLTLAHNLTVAPELVITKKRSAINEWYVSHTFTGTGYKRQYLEQTAAATDHLYSANFIYTAKPTASSLFFTDNSNVNQSGQTFVHYLFASLPGVSKVGSYTGTGATQVINCGFTGGARFVLIKATSTTGNWMVWDTARGIITSVDPYLMFNSKVDEITSTDWVDPAASGFELSNAAGNLANSNGVSYIFLAIA